MTNKVSQKNPKRNASQSPMMTKAMKYVVHQTSDKELQRQMAVVAVQAREALKRKPPLRPIARIHDV